jgi:transglutaminase-like putative cysteine protease
MLKNDAQKRLIVSVSLFAIILAIIFSAGCIGTEIISQITTGSLHGTITDTKEVPLSDVSVSLISLAENGSTYNEITDERGEYKFTDVPADTYNISLEKEGYRNVTFPVLIMEQVSMTWNATIVRDCIYYPVNASVNYAVRYGYNGTVYHGYITYVTPYPDGANYSVFPNADITPETCIDVGGGLCEMRPGAGGGLSQLSTTYKAGNRMLAWKLNNSEGSYPSVSGYLYIDLKGTGNMWLFDNKKMSISKAASSQPSYLGSETSTDGRLMINPSDSEIKSIAEEVKQETGSNDTWTLAEAMFKWLKNNTEYYRGPESDNYTQTATEVLSNHRGDCDELSFLYISLCRAIGIPARFVEGYMVTINPDEPEGYAGHVWAEFYDGEWVPVEVATEGKVNVANDAIRHFGITLPDHVPVFVEDGTSESLNRTGSGGSYRDRMPSFSPYVYYDAVNYDPMYLTVCSNGTERTRTLTKEKE